MKPILREGSIRWPKGHYRTGPMNPAMNANSPLEIVVPMNMRTPEEVADILEDLLTEATALDIQDEVIPETTSPNRLVAQIRRCFRYLTPEQQDAYRARVEAVVDSLHTKTLSSILFVLGQLRTLADQSYTALDSAMRNLYYMISSLPENMQVQLTNPLIQGALQIAEPIIPGNPYYIEGLKQIVYTHTEA